jgi:7,8-dihydro-6-hydroxymethylpterin-pyrophosphokinase
MPSDGSCWHRAFIALGSNLGDRVGAIERACCEMERAGIRVKKTSSLFETAPMYVTDQEPFINGACEVGILLFYTRQLVCIPDSDIVSLDRNHNEAYRALGRPSIHRNCTRQI